MKPRHSYRTRHRAKIEIYSPFEEIPKYAPAVRFVFLPVLAENSIHPTQPRLNSPRPGNNNRNPSRRLRLSQVGHVPHSRWTTGLSAPPPMPRFSPQSLMLPRSVNVTPTAVGGEPIA